MDGRPDHRNEAAFLNFSGLVRTLPYTASSVFFATVFSVLAWGSFVYGSPT